MNERNIFELKIEIILKINIDILVYYRQNKIKIK